MWPTTTTLVPPPSLPIRPFHNSYAQFPPPPERFPAALNTAHTRRRRHQASATSDGVGGLGRVVLSAAALRSSPPKTENPGSNPQKGKQKKDEPKREEKGKEMSGSDILWALQRASARKAQIKKKQQMQKRNLNGRSENPKANVNTGVDYDKIRPVTINSDWATRLDDLQKRLQEFVSF